MQPFEFVMILVSMIVALGVAELLRGVVRIFRGDLKFYWIHGVWALTILFLQLQYCWTLFDLESHIDWVILDLARLVVAPILLFLASSLIFPRRDERTDLSHFYFEHRRPIFGLLASLMLYYTVLNIAPTSITFIQISGFGVLATLFITSNPKVHAALSLIFFTAAILFVGSHSYTLGETSF